MGKKHEWQAAKAFYINGGWQQGITLKKVAERYNIPYQTVRRQAAKDEWRLIREWKSVDDECKTLEEYKCYYK